MIKIQKKDLSAALTRCNQIAVQGSPSPYVDKVRVVFDNVLQYSVTNLSTSLVGTLDAAGEAESFTVNCDSLANAVKNVLGESVKLTVDKNRRLKVKGDGKREFTMPTLDANEFPAIDYTPDAPVVTVSGESLRALLSKVQFAIASYRDARNGTDNVLIQINDGMLIVWATDGKVLARAEDATEASGDFRAIVPRGVIAPILAQSAEHVGMYVTKNEIGFKTDNEVLIQRATSGEFPQLENAIAAYKTNKSSLVAASSVLDSLSAIRSADSNKMVSLKFSTTELEIEGGSNDGDRYAMDTVSAVGEESKQITVSAEYITGALKGFANANFGFTSDPADALTITDGGFTVIIMPILK